MHEARFLLAALSLPGFGRKTVRRVYTDLPELPNDEESTADAIKPLRAAAGIDANVLAVAFAEADAAIEEAQKADVLVLAFGTDRFPRQLELIDDPPLLLFVKGDLGALHSSRIVAVIGTREPTDFGARCAHRFGLRCAENKFVVVSGLAKGCDAAAHVGCLDGRGQTVAVLAHGLDKVYPRENAALAESIVEQGGALVSEYPLSARAQRSYFVERDRIQSGLSKGIVVVETDVEGGTMHTVRFAEKQGRLLACLAHPPEHADSFSARGNQLLIREGRARPLHNADELVVFLKAVGDKAARPSAGVKGG